MATIAKIPPEILIEVFKLQPSVLDALHLAGTCKKIQMLWIDNSTSIAGDVLPRELMFYDELEYLTCAQEELGFTDILKEKEAFKAKLLAQMQSLQDEEPDIYNALYHHDFSYLEKSIAKISVSHEEVALNALQKRVTLSSSDMDTTFNLAYSKSVQHFCRLYQNRRDATVFTSLLPARSFVSGFRNPGHDGDCQIHLQPSMPWERKRVEHCFYVTKIWALANLHHSGRLLAYYSTTVEQMRREKIFSYVAQRMLQCGTIFSSAPSRDLG